MTDIEEIFLAIMKDIFPAIDIFLVAILVLITIMYQKSTSDILKEQQKAARNKEIIYALENVYSPLLKSITDFMTELMFDKTYKKEEWLDIANLFYSTRYIQNNYMHVLQLDDMLKISIFKISKLISKIAENLRNEIDPSKNFIALKEDCEDFYIYLYHQIDVFNSEMKIEKINEWENEKEKEIMKGIVKNAFNVSKREIEDAFGDEFIHKMK